MAKTASNRAAIRMGMTPSHPGQFIDVGILEPAGVSVSDAADALGVRRATLSDLVNEKAKLTPEMAIRIEKVFGWSADLLLAMQAKRDAHDIRLRASEFEVKPMRFAESPAATYTAKPRTAAGDRGGGRKSAPRSRRRKGA